MRPVLALLLLLILFTGCEPLAVEGVVVNESNQPIAGATLSVQARQPGGGSSADSVSLPRAVTDARGRFTLSPLQVDDRILVSAEGYEPLTEVFDAYLTRRGRLDVMLRQKPGVR